jgi:hypothetical protein
MRGLFARACFALAATLAVGLAGITATQTRAHDLLLIGVGGATPGGYQGPEDIAGTALRCAMLTACSVSKAAALQAILLWSCPSGSPSSGTLHLAATGYPNQTEVSAMFSGCGANTIFATNLCDQDANNGGCAGAADFVQTGGSALQFQIIGTCQGLDSRVGFCLDATSSAGRCMFATSGGPGTIATLQVVAYRYNVGNSGNNSHNDMAVENNGTGFGAFFNFVPNTIRGGNLGGSGHVDSAAQTYPGWFRVVTTLTGSASNLWVDDVNTNSTGASFTGGSTRQLFANATNCAGSSLSNPGIFAEYVLWSSDVGSSAAALDANMHARLGI